MDPTDEKAFCTYCTKNKGQEITGNDLVKFKIDQKFYIIGDNEITEYDKVDPIIIKDEPNVKLTTDQNKMIKEHGVLKKKKLGVFNVDFTV